MRGANNSVKVATLPVLKVIGSNNKAVVTKGRTKVSVRGANNVVRVKKRA